MTESTYNEPMTLSGEPVPRVCGAVLGLAGFSTALLVGLVTGNPATNTLLRGLLCMAICVAVGRVIGWAGELATREFLDQFREANPEPQTPEELVRLQERRNRHKAIIDEVKRGAA